VFLVYHFHDYVFFYNCMRVSGRNLSMFDDPFTVMMLVMCKWLLLQNSSSFDALFSN
jgi:hypothetical protein